MTEAEAGKPEPLADEFRRHGFTVEPVVGIILRAKAILELKETFNCIFKEGQL